ncbi:MAG: DUF4352 domain-containing protein [Methanoregula sp.]
MAVKRCPRCKTDNPVIYEHCIKCGGPLPPVRQRPGGKKILALVVIVMLVVLATVYLVIPTLHLSAATGKNLSAAISVGAASPTPIPRYGIRQPARNSDLQVTVTQTRAGENTFNAGRFYTVTVSIQNFNRDTGLTIPASAFVLLDSDGNYYTSSGIGSRVSYDALPGTTGTVDLVYIVPQDAEGLRILYTFPDSTVSGAGPHEVAFVL